MFQRAYLKPAFFILLGVFLLYFSMTVPHKRSSTSVIGRDNSSTTSLLYCGLGSLAFGVYAFRQARSKNKR